MPDITLLRLVTLIIILFALAVFAGAPFWADENDRIERGDDEK